ncbi:MAG: CO2 hydration protein [Cyanobacteria bacterium P01_H01_bin.121]
MVTSALQPSKHPLAAYIHQLESGQSLLPHSPQNLLEVVGILKSYGVVLDAYSNNLNYIAEHQFLVFFPFFKYFNGEVSTAKLLRHWWHDRINYEYAEYCMKAMLWHGGGGLSDYLETPEFMVLAQKAIAARIQTNPLLRLTSNIFPEFLLEQVRQLAYYSGLGQFWRVMSDIFLTLSDRYDAQDLPSIDAVVTHIRAGLVAAASKPITYGVSIRDQYYELLPPVAGLTFLTDTAVPYVEAIFFRGTPFPGTVSYNAQAYQIPFDQAEFAYGALFADPLPIGSAGVPPTLLMQDMRHFLPDYLQQFYQDTGQRTLADLRVKICESFQKSMFCVTTAAIQGLAPAPLGTDSVVEQQQNRAYLEQWMNRFLQSRLRSVNPAYQDPAYKDPA